MQTAEYAEADYAQTVLVNGQQVVLDRLQEGEGPDDPKTLSIVLDRPEPISLLTVGSWVQVKVAGNPPTPYRVKSVEEYEGNPTPEDRSLVYGVKLEEVLSFGDTNDESSDAIDVLYRTAFMTIVSRTYVRALGQILEAKGIVTGEEFQEQVVHVVHASFLDFARNIVAEEEAESMQRAMLQILERPKTDSASTAEKAG